MEIQFNLSKKHIQIAVAVLVLVGFGAIVWWRAATLPAGADKKPAVSGTHPQTVTVNIDDKGFSPSQLTIVAGDTVKFVNTDTKPHWPASDPHPTHDYYPEFDAKQEVAPGQSWEFVATKPGDWGFHDHLIPHNKGELIIEASTTDTSNQASTVTPEISVLKAETDPQKQAKIVHAMAEKYGTLETLKMMRDGGMPYTGETHLLVHEVGNVAYEKYGTDALKYCDDSFLSACYHGVILNALGDHGLQGLADMVAKCKEAGPTVLAQCAHGAGHGFLAWKDYKVMDALPYCDQLHEMDADIPIFNCQDGLFMENIFGVHDGAPSPNRLVKPSDLYYPCDVMPAHYQPGCWSNQASLIYQLVGGDLRKTALACDGVKDKDNQRICYDNFARQIHPLTEGNAAKGIELCKNATGIWQDRCLTTLMNAAFSVGDRTTMPYAMCPAEHDPTEKQYCYDGLFNDIGAYATTKSDRQQLCGHVTEADREQQCINKFN